MQLSREGIQRMIGNLGSISTAAGGGGEGGSGSQWVNDNFVAIPYWNQLFTIYGKQTVTVTDGTTGDVTVTETDMTLPPNTLPSTVTTTDPETGDVTETKVEITRIEALYDFDSVGGVSALGYNPGGGGGGADLNKLLDNINSSNIGNIDPTASEVGKCLVYNGNNQWAWATPGGGGGLTYGLSWSYGSVSGAQGGSYDGSASKSFIIPKDTSHLSNDAGFITSSALSGYLPLSGGTMTGAIIMKGVHIYMDPADSSSNSTGDIVFRYGSGQEKARIWMDDTFSTVVGPQFRIYKTDGTQLVSTRLALASQLTDYVKWTSVNQTSYSRWGKIPFVNSGGSMDIGKTLEFHSSNNDSIDYNAVVMLDNTKAYNGVMLYLPDANGTLATQAWVNSNVVTNVSAGTGITTDPSTGIVGTGTVSISSTYQTYISHGESAYNSLNSYLLKSDGMKFYIMNNSYVRAEFNPDGGRAAKAQGEGCIEWWASGGFFNHHMGNVAIGQDATDTSHYLQIGGGRIYWDYDSKSLYVVQADGSTPANIYATGGVSALGISTGGTPSVSELTVGTLKGVRYLQNASGAVSITSGNSYIYIGAGSGSNVYIADSNNTYFDTNGHLHLKGKYLYLDDTRYVYVSNGHLYFNNGSSNIQIA